MLNEAETATTKVDIMSQGASISPASMEPVITAEVITEEVITEEDAEPSSLMMMNLPWPSLVCGPSMGGDVMTN